MKSSSKKSESFKTLGGFLRAKRIERGLTQSEVGKVLGVHLMFISRFELNKCSVPYKHLKKLIKLYKVSPEIILKISLEEEKKKLKKFLA